MVIKRGRGNKSNSSFDNCVYDEELNKYYAKTSFGSSSGIWNHLYEINKEIFDKVNTFEDDDYKSERLIATGKLLYRYEDCNCCGAPGPIEEIIDENYKDILEKYFKKY